MFPCSCADCASTNGAPHRQSKCWVPGKWDVDETLTLNPVRKVQQNKKIVHNPKEHNPDGDARYVDFKPIMISHSFHQLQETGLPS